MRNESLNYTFKDMITTRYSYSFYLLELYMKVYINQDYKYICSFKIPAVTGKGNYNERKENFFQANDIDFITAGSYLTWIAIKSKEDLLIVRKLLKICEPDLDLDKVLRISSLNILKKKCAKYQNALARKLKNPKNIARIQAELNNKGKRRINLSGI